MTVPKGCLRDASAGPRRCPLLVRVVRWTDGTIRRTGSVWGPTVTINTLTGGVTPADDGARVYVEYKCAECAGAEKYCGGTTELNGWRPTTTTTIRVAAADAAAVIRQDTAVPVIHGVEYPRTQWRQPVEVHVRASAVGQRGQRRTANGSIVSTELTYQWYNADKKKAFVEVKPRLMEGRTGPILALDEAVCNNQTFCGKYSCGGLTRYVAEVCSTAGCTRSPKVYPVVVPPADEAWAEQIRNQYCEKSP